MSEQKLQARVYSRTAPTEEQLAQLRDFLHQKYQRPVNLHWERDDRMKDGFRLELGEGESRELVYDWSSSGKTVAEGQDRRRHPQPERRYPAAPQNAGGFPAGGLRD